MNEPGQILPESPLGEALTKLAKDAENIVETGTWNGRGSTQCLRLGLSRPTQRIWTVETNAERHTEAKQVHADEPRITCLLGTIVSGHEMPGFVGDKAERDAFTAEVAQNNDSPCVFDHLPASIDLLLVDGGAYSGFAEVTKLRDRCQVIVLDDVFTDKNIKSFGLLSYSRDWMPEMVRKDRYGWAVFKRL